MVGGGDRMDRLPWFLLFNNKGTGCIFSLQFNKITV